MKRTQDTGDRSPTGKKSNPKRQGPKKVAKWQQQIKYIITHKNKPNSNASFNNNNTVGRRRGRARRLVGGEWRAGGWGLNAGAGVEGY